MIDSIALLTTEIFQSRPSNASGDRVPNRDHLPPAPPPLFLRRGGLAHALGFSPDRDRADREHGTLGDCAAGVDHDLGHLACSRLLLEDGGVLDRVGCRFGFGFFQFGFVVLHTHDTPFVSCTLFYLSLIHI